MNRRLIKTIATMLLMLLPVSMMAAWSYTASGNVLSAYGEGGYTASAPLSITLNAPADLQFNGNYKPATISNTDAWTAAGLTVPTILYDGTTNAPSMLGTYTATISAGGATAAAGVATLGIAIAGVTVAAVGAYGVIKQLYDASPAGQLKQAEKLRDEIDYTRQSLEATRKTVNETLTTYEE